jgi:hypothetical protein
VPNGTNIPIITPITPGVKILSVGILTFFLVNTLMRFLLLWKSFVEKEIQKQLTLDVKI